MVRLRFDGAMDVHLSGDSVGFLTGVLDWTVSVPPMVLIAFGVARLAKSEARLLDVALAVIGARWVLMIVGLLTLGIPRDISVTNPVLLVFALAMLPLLGLYFVNLFRSYRTATGLEGGRLWLAYLTTLIVSEALSKLALVLIG